MATTLVIVHGWSDTSESFIKLRDAIKSDGELGRRYGKMEFIYLADWLSKDDLINLRDVSVAMNRAWLEKKLPVTPRSVDAIVHSTGALVVRDWVRLNHDIWPVGYSPLHHVVQLAPANHGSPLAHKGRAMLGRIIKGWNNWFEVGERILKALEMGSPFTYDLAKWENKGCDTNHWRKNAILGTVLVGNAGYGGVQCIANKNGSDGTVYISTARHDAPLLKASFPCEGVDKSPVVEMKNPLPLVAFRLINGRNHSTIHDPDIDATNIDIMKFIRLGLTIDDNVFEQYVSDSIKETRVIPADGKRFQNLVVHLYDNQGEDIQDYFLEFTAKMEDELSFFTKFQSEILEGVHEYSENKSYRSLLINIELLREYLDKKHEELHISLTARPLIQMGRTSGPRVGYRSLTAEDIGDIRIPYDRIDEYFDEHRTLYVDIVIERSQHSDVFEFSKQ